MCAPEIPVEDGTPYVGGTGSGGNAGDVPSDDDPGFGFGTDSGCSIGGNTAKGAGGAVPLAGLFLAMLVLRSLGRRRFAGLDAGAVLAEVSDTRLEVGMELEEALPVTVTVWVSNPGETEVDFLLWNTPFETTLSADVFEVVSGEARLPYEGRMIKRGVPPASAWISLSPGQRHEVQVDLGSVYDFSSAGVYVVRLAPTSQGDVQRFNPSAVVEVVTPPVQIACRRSAVRSRLAPPFLPPDTCSPSVRQLAVSKSWQSRPDDRERDHSKQRDCHADVDRPLFHEPRLPVKGEACKQGGVDHVGFWIQRL